jgi:hypothetical protein
MGIGRLVEKADANGIYAKGRHRLSYHYWLKRWKARAERRKAKRDPESGDGYGKYRGWEL